MNTFSRSHTGALNPIDNLQWLFVRSGHRFLEITRVNRSCSICFRGIFTVRAIEVNIKIKESATSRDCPFADEYNWRSIYRMTRWSCLLFARRYSKKIYSNTWIHVYINKIYVCIYMYVIALMGWIGLTIYRIPIVFDRGRKVNLSRKSCEAYIQACECSYIST